MEFSDKYPYEKYQDIIICMIEERNWKSLTKAFESSSFVIAGKLLHKHPHMYGASILHILLRNHPSIEIIDTIIEHFPETLARTDCAGRTPLHVAAGIHVHFRIFRRILKGFPKACLIQDTDLKCPLHLACDSSCTLYDDESDLSRGQPSRAVIWSLAKAAPSTVLIEDCDECNAVEYAILSEADRQVVGLLQHVGVEENRKRDASLETLKYDEMRALEHAASCLIRLGPSGSATSVIGAEL